MLEKPQDVAKEHAAALEPEELQQLQRVKKLTELVDESKLKSHSLAKEPEDGSISKAPAKRMVQAHQTAQYLVELVLVLVACLLGGKVGLAIPFTSGNHSCPN